MGVSDNPLLFVRGFMERFIFTAGPFLRYGPQLLDRTPVRKLWLSVVGRGRVEEELVRCPWLREVPALSFEGAGLTTDATVRLATAEWLVGTRRLSLAGNGLRDPAARALAESDRVRGLTLLDLSANSFTLAGVERLLASSHLRDCHFRLVGNPHLLDDHHAVRRLLGPRGSV